MRKKSKKKKSAFQLNRGIITENYIKSLEVLDSYMHLRFLKDSKKGFYVIFNNYTRNFLQTRDCRFAREFFEKQANKLD